MNDLKEKNQTLRLFALCFFLALSCLLGADRLLSADLLAWQKKDAKLQDSLTRLALDRQAAATLRKKERSAATHHAEIAAYQSHTQQFLENLSAGAPKRVCFSHLSRNKSQLEWQGYALSSSHLFAYLAEVAKSKAFQSVTLLNLQQEGLQQKVAFKVRLKESVPLNLEGGVEGNES